MISFTIPGQPKGKARPRMCKSGHVYTPSGTVIYEHRVQAAYLAVAGTVNPRDEISTVEIVAYFAAPKRIHKKLIGENDWLPCGSRPDADNVAKIVCDALNKIAWTDDARVATLKISKRYAMRPRVKVSIVWDEGE